MFGGIQINFNNLEKIRNKFNFIMRFQKKIMQFYFQIDILKNWQLAIEMVGYPH